MKTVPNEVQRRAIRKALRNDGRYGHIAPAELKDTPFADKGFLTAYALQFANDPETDDESQHSASVPSAEAPRVSRRSGR